MTNAAGVGVRRVLVGVVLAATVLAGQASMVAAAAHGSLVRTTMHSQVGVVLDEIPKSMRGRVTAQLMAEPDSFWTQRAHTQIKLTTYRLVFRYAFYPRRRQALPLPPEPLWDVAIVGKPRRETVNGHDVVAVDYHFSSVLLSDKASPGESEPKLARVGGQWREPFIFPIDPELVMQRTGYACMDESAFPFASVDSEEVDSFYDQTAVVEKKLSPEGYHYTVMPTESCVQALRTHVGMVKTSVLFERLAWDPKVADQYRYGEVTGRAPDLATYVTDFLPSRTVYRYIHEAGSGGCEVAEETVSGTGWRRLLEFGTSDENVGERDLTIGGVDYTISGNPGELDAHNLYEFSPCHGHYHFKYYGDLSWSGDGTIVNAKKGFCLQSTYRAANRETSPLHNTFASCDYQGISAGWVDQYKAGLSGQWLDTTDLPVGTGTRSFTSNPNGFLCEGRFVDENGNPLPPGEPVVWAPTGLIADNGKPVEAPLCGLKRGWDANNGYDINENIQRQGLGMLTDPCERGQIGPLRNCGFGRHPQTASCVPGAKTTITFSIPRDSSPQVVRVTEFSHALNSPIPARYEDSWVPLTPGVSDPPSMLKNVIVMPSVPRRVTFACPAPRTGGDFEPGGTFSIYTAPVFPGDARAIVSAAAS